MSNQPKGNQRQEGMKTPKKNPSQNQNTISNNQDVNDEDVNQSSMNHSINKSKGGISPNQSNMQNDPQQKQQQRKNPNDPNKPQQISGQQSPLNQQQKKPQQQQQPNLQESNPNQQSFNQNPDQVMSTRSYLEQTVASVVQEGMIELAKNRPPNPLEFLGNFILERARNMNK